MASLPTLKNRLQIVEIRLRNKSSRTNEENDLLQELQELLKELNTELLTEFNEFKTRTKRFAMAEGVCGECGRPL